MMPAPLSGHEPIYLLTELPGYQAEKSPFARQLGRPGRQRRRKRSSFKQASEEGRLGADDDERVLALLSVLERAGVSCTAWDLIHQGLFAPSSKSRTKG